LNFVVSSNKSTCPKNIDLQQYLSSPSSSSTLPGASPLETFSLNCSHRWAIGLPQLKQRIGIIILNSYYKP